MNFTSDLGVFSKDKVDFGSQLLVENYIKRGYKNVRLLDVGCGYGYIGISLAKIMGVEATMVDVNRRALHLAKKNATANGVSCQIFESNIYESVTGTFDIILTNPPIRAGKETVWAFLNGAIDHLEPNGELWFVMKKDHGAKSAIKNLETKAEVTIIDRSKGFYIIVAKNVDKNTKTC